MSKEFSKSETPRHFVIELLLFAIIGLLCAWPMFAMAAALAELFRR